MREALPSGADLRRVFRHIDRDGDGVLTPAEFKRGLRDLTQRNLTEANIEAIFEQVDERGDCTVDYREFCDLFDLHDDAEATASELKRELRRRLHTHGDYSDKKLAAAFEEFDTNRDGLLSAKDFQRGLQKLGISISTAKLQMMMAVADTDGDAHIDWHEFVRMFSNQPDYPLHNGSSPRSSQNCDKVVVRVLRGHGLISRDRNGKSDPYAPQFCTWF